MHAVAHRNAYDRVRGSSSERGYDYDWQRFTKYLDGKPENVWCRACKAAGKLVRKVLYDHITPLSRGGARLSEANLQPLCQACHNEKTANEGG